MEEKILRNQSYYQRIISLRFVPKHPVLGVTVYKHKGDITYTDFFGLKLFKKKVTENIYLYKGHHYTFHELIFHLSHYDEKVTVSRDGSFYYKPKIEINFGTSVSRYHFFEDNEGAKETLEEIQKKCKISGNDLI
jgi:hypothetical protein